MRDWNGKRVTVVGLGKTGLAAARYFHRRGARVLVTEAAATPGIMESAQLLRGEGIAVETGGHGPDAFGAVECIVLSPGVPVTLPALAEAASRGVPVWSELEAVWPDAKAPIAALTGTNGKTTTTALLDHLVRQSGASSVLCGNNDLPLSAALDRGEKADWYVVEVSSYQLESAHTFRPRVGAALNVTPDHPRHGTLQQYAAVKARIFQALQPGDVAVVNQDCPLTSAMPTPEGVRRLTFSLRGHGDAQVVDGRLRFQGQPVLAVERLRLKGNHNIANALAAMTMAMAMHLPLSAIAEGLASFSGVRHRIEHIADIDGVPCYNDSKSTNLDSLRVALQSFHEPVVLIAGGRGKESDYSTLTDLVRDKVAALIAIGEDGPAMRSAWGDTVTCRAASSMDEAVAIGLGCAPSGAVLLLSPGCASFDWYNNFEERGDDFRACVLRRAAAPAHGRN